MFNVLTIWQKELKTYFMSSIAYVTAFFYLALTAWVFLEGVQEQVGTEKQIPALLIMSTLLFLPVLATVITMRLFAEERRMGTIEMLMTAPVTETQVVLGKYAGALTFTILVLLPAIAFAFVLAALSPGIREVDTGAVIGGGLILLLISAFAVSIGMVVSILTRNQIVAAIGCIFFICAPFLVSKAVSLLPAHWDKLGAYISIEEHVLGFSKGIVDSRPLVLYSSCTLLLIFASVRLLQLRRWR
jgi:ABC-2 type transport system permease protein